jgi:periplasmic divalent cation tolerance protein
MDDKTDFVVVLSTVPTDLAGREIARAIVTERLAACVNIIPGVVSIYEWDGRLEESSEALLIMKTTERLAKQLIVRTRQLHPYEVPEIITLPIRDGHEPYFDWIKAMVGLADDKEVTSK